MVGRRIVMTMSRKKNDHRVVIPYSNDGRHTSLGCIGDLFGIGQLDVGQGWGGQPQEVWWSPSHISGHIQCTLKSSIHTRRHILVIVAIGCQRHDLPPAAFLHLLQPL